LREKPGIILWIGRDLGECDMTRRFNEGGEFGVTRRSGVYLETVDTDGMPRRFLRVMIIGSHLEGAALEPHHFLGL
jgi:hypothetical protein